MRFQAHVWEFVTHVRASTRFPKLLSCSFMPVVSTCNAKKTQMHLWPEADARYCSPTIYSATETLFDTQQDDTVLPKFGRSPFQEFTCQPLDLTRLLHKEALFLVRTYTCARSALSSPAAARPLPAPPTPRATRAASPHSAGQCHRSPAHAAQGVSTN